MDWLMSILCLIAGIVIGFFVAKFLFEPKQSVNDSQDEEKSQKQFMAEQANLHIHESQTVLRRIQEQCDALNEQLTHYQQVMDETSRETTDSNLEYFSQQASLHLKTQKREAAKQRANADYQPLDYSEGNSGLLAAGAAKKHSETSQNS